MLSRQTASAGNARTRGLCEGEAAYYATKTRTVKLGEMRS